MAVPNDNKLYPQYFITKRALYAFIAKDKMYKIENKGSNCGNTGVTIDYFITRRMVILHYPTFENRVTEEKFKTVLQKLFSAYIDKIITGS